MSGPSLQPTSAPNPWVLPTNTDAVLNAAEEREESVEMIDAALSGAEDEEKPAVFESTDGPKPEVPEEITFLGMALSFFCKAQTVDICIRL